MDGGHVDNVRGLAVKKLILVTEDDALAELARHLARQPRVAFDTESDNLYHYRERVCLIQVATPEQTWLIDPLAVDDMQPLGAVFASPEVEKIFHGADYDLACLKRDFRFKFTRLFDTMIAAQLLGRDGWGLAALAREELGVTLPKTSQRADWSRRPLSDEMQRYAADDVNYLIALRDRLAAALDSVDRLHWLQEECETLCRRTRPHRGNSANGDAYLRIKGAKKLAPRELARLRELYHVRDGWARRLDRPAFKVIGNGTLLQLACSRPTCDDEMLRVRGMSRRVIDRLGRDVLQALAKADTLAPEELPQVPSQPRRPRLPGMLARIDGLRAWRRRKAAQRKLDAGVLLSQNLIKLLAAANPRTPEELRDVEGLREWRVDAFGSELLDVLQRADGD
jgi:ribonuclease D